MVLSRKDPRYTDPIENSLLAEASKIKISAVLGQIVAATMYHQLNSMDGRSFGGGVEGSGASGGPVSTTGVNPTLFAPGNDTMQVLYPRSSRLVGGPIDESVPELILAIKILITNSQAGALIGAQGNAVKELIQITSARISVSEHSYPGTPGLRTVFITGSEEAVGLAASMIIELIGQEELARARLDRDAWTWSPKSMSANAGRTSNTDVSLIVAIPSTAAGVLLGKGGSTKRAIEEESGIALAFSPKNCPNHDITQERTVHLTGKTGNCINAVYLILDKFMSNLEAAQFVVKGTTFGGVKTNYSVGSTSSSPRVPGLTGSSNPAFVQLQSSVGSHVFHNHLGPSIVPSGSPARKSGGMLAVGGGMPGGIAMAGVGGRGTEAMVRELSASTVVELAVHDAHVGSLIGPGGSKLREISGLSGAKIVVSSRKDMPEDTRERKVTIEGSPSCVAAAKELVLHILGLSEGTALLL